MKTCYQCGRRVGLFLVVYHEVGGVKVAFHRELFRDCWEQYQKSAFYKPSEKPDSLLDSIRKSGW